MNVLVSVLLVAVGLAIVLFFSERLVKSVGGLASGLGVSAFLLSVVFLGFDPENLGVGVVGSLQGASGIALGTIVGSAMVATALSFGVAALVAPMRFAEAPRQVLAVPILAIVLLGALALDGELSRLDGAILVCGYAAALIYLGLLSRGGVDIQAGKGEVGKELREARGMGTGRAAVMLLVSLAAIIVGAELLVTGTRDLIGAFGLSQTVVGMTILALAISIEELARTVPAALQGRPDISYGTVNGSVLAFFLFNAGLIALVSPLEVGKPTLLFYLPLTFVSVVVLSFFLLTRAVPRWSGGLLVSLYAVFVIGGYLLFGGAPA